MGFLIGAVLGVALVLSVIYFVLRRPAPDYRVTDQETWKDNLSTPLNQLDNWNDDSGDN